MTEDVWDELVEKYEISGYTNSLIFVNYETFKELVKKAEGFDYWQSQDPTTVKWLTEHRKLIDKLEAVRAGLPNMAGVDMAIQDVEYILKCLNVTKDQIKILEADVDG